MFHFTKGISMHTFSGKPCILFGVTLVVVLLVGCSKDDVVVNNNQIVGSGKLVTQIRIVDTYNGIQVTNFAKVAITQDTVEQLRIESDDNVIEHVLTSVSRGTLVVGLENGSYNNVTVNVYASMKSIKRLESVGAADFSTTNLLQTDSILCRITGTGTITLTGNAFFEQVEIIGAGSIHNFDLVANHCVTTIAGSGAIEVNAASRLDAFITGTGSIVYDGHPQTVQQIVTGVGSVKPR
jgi:hypothetical protein